MRLYFRQVRPSTFKPKSTFPKTAMRHSVLAIACGAALVSTGLAASLAVLGVPSVSAEGVQLPELALGKATGGIKAQVLMNSPRTMLNPEVFNSTREKAIANDSKKLLQLAIELREEVDSSSIEEPSPAAIAKAREIEKLAKDVKSRMSISPSLEMR